MPTIKGVVNKRLMTWMGVIMVCGLLSACIQKPVRPDAAVAAAPDSSEAFSKEIDNLKAENKELKKAFSLSEKKVNRQKDTLGSVQRELASVRIQLLEKEVLIDVLNQRFEDQQKRMDDAIIEVVRTKAKLRSIESKAEAASTIAETEIAAKVLKNQAEAAGLEDLEEMIKAESLLKISTTEFSKQNFGGALYLAGQAKNQIRAGHIQLGGNRDDRPVEGEMAFLQPLPLKSVKNSNFRSGPGLTFKIITELKKGTRIIGYAHKGDWIRADTEDGLKGWIFKALVGAR